jgi:2-hydroxyglutarate dehydrogenase
VSTRAEHDLAVVGGGILGLAVACELLQRHPSASLTLLEREPRIGTHQTGHNSGVIHQGIYYKPGSLKAALCVEGARRMYAYCERKGIKAEAAGKLIIALTPEELPRLDDLERRGIANGVPELRRVAADEIADVEPHAVGVAALHSPQTGVVDFLEVARALRDDLIEAGGEVRLGCQVTGVRTAGDRITLEHHGGEITARHAVFCAGAWSDRLAVLCGGDADPRIVPFRGGYLRLRRDRRFLVRSLIYPVPDPELPFLGVHLTRHVDGEVALGPTALLAGARDAYDLSRLNRRDLTSTLTWPGTYRMVRRFWRTGVTELRTAVHPAAFVAEAARYVPELQAADAMPGIAGVRAQAVGRDGKLIDDFVFSHTEHALHVRNAPSPAATSSLAIAAHVADQAEQALGITTLKEPS